jgi:hypothetical protein
MLGVRKLRDVIQNIKATLAEVIWSRPVFATQLKEAELKFVNFGFAIPQCKPLLTSQVASTRLFFPDFT